MRTIGVFVSPYPSFLRLMLLYTYRPFASAASLVLPPATCHDAQPFVTVGSTSTPPLVHDNMDWLSTPTLISRVQNHWIDEDGAAALLVEVQGPANGRFAIVGVVQAELQPGIHLVNNHPNYYFLCL